MEDPTKRTKHRVRLLQILRAAERAALAPIDMGKLHAFAYLADILSPVWQLRPFETIVGVRDDRPPYYPDFQRELDLLVAMGLVEPSELAYTAHSSTAPARFSACYALRATSEHLRPLLAALDADQELAQEQEYLDALADALASIPDDDIAQAARRDLAYDESGQDYLELDPASHTSRTSVAVASFDEVFPSVRLNPARRLYMYASYLGRRVHG